MDKPAPYSTRDIRNAVNLSALLGWLIVAQNTVLFILMVACIGLPIRAAIGPGRAKG